MGKMGEMGNVRGLREFESYMLSGEGISDKRVEPVDPHAFPGSKRRTLHQKGASVQFMSNELSNNLNEQNVSGYTRADRHDLSILVNDREMTIALSEDIYTLRQTLRATPDQSWENVAASFPSHPSVDTSIGRKFLEQRFARFVSSRQALRYWLEKYNGSEENTKQQITDHLQMPEDLHIQDIAFRHNSCALFMMPSDITAYIRYLDKSAGVDISDYHDAGAFSCSDLYLEDDKGNRCAIIIVPYYTDKTQQAWVYETLLHEEEHTNFYYYENEFLEPSTPAINRRASFTIKALDALQRVNRTNQASVERILVPMTHNVLSDYRLLFYNEMVASGASSIIDTDKCEEVAQNFDPVGLDGIYQYARTMILEVDGLIDSLRSTSLFNEQKLQIWWNIERNVAQFTVQNYTLEKWLDKLWETGNEDRERYVSRMYALSVTKPWNIGWFIDEDPRKLRKDLFKEPDTERIIRRMMARNMQEINTDSLQQQKQAYIESITEVIQRRFNSAQTLTDEVWEDAARELFLSCYLPTYLQMAQSIYETQKELIQRVNTAGIADIDTYDAARFTKEYLEWFLGAEMIFIAIDNYSSTSGREDLQKALQSKWWRVTSIKTDSGDKIRKVIEKKVRAMWD